MKKLKYILLIIIVLFALQLYIDANYIEISSFKVLSDKVPESFDGVKIVHLSDLHSKEFGAGNKRLLKKINDIKPDIIVMTGDMVSASDTNFDVFLDLARNLGMRYECYYIVGNHELDLSKQYYDEIMESLEKSGITILDNEKIVLERESDVLNLYGMWYNAKYYMQSDLTSDVIEQIIGKDDDENFDLLLTHNPKHFETYVDWGADLILSGHVHGGMVRLPFIGAVFSPERTLFPKYSAGAYEKDGGTMIVSRGLGRGTTGFRLFNRPEVCVITLENSK